MNEFKFFRGFVNTEECYRIFDGRELLNDIEQELINELSEQISQEIDNDIVRTITRQINGEDTNYLNHWINMGNRA